MITMINRTLTGLGAVLLSLAAVMPIHAQETATLVLVGGERPSGQLADLSASGFMLVTNGQERTYSANDVAVVEFAGGALPGDAQARVNAGQSLVLLRNGQVVEGRLSDIGGARPLRLTIDTPSGQRDFSSSDVAQIHLRPLRQAVAAAQAQTASIVSAGAITVNAAQQWTDTGITVRRGDRVTFTATGDVTLGPGVSSGTGGSPAATNPSMKYPLPGAFIGALIGKIGTGAPFLIGTNSQPLVMNGSGRLLLGVNDDHVPDNSGAYSVAIQSASGTTTLRRR